MSMLTPPGMKGRKYRITGNRYPRMRSRPRRRRRNVVAVLAAVVLIGVLSYGTLQLVGVLTADEDSGGAAGAGVSRAGGADCAQPGEEQDGPKLPAALPKPEAITVNVYNATKRTGLAADTADALASRGFTIGEIDNAPPRLDGKVEESGLLLATKQAESAGVVAVVGTQLAGAETGEPKAKGAPDEVDLVIGHGFTELLSPPEAERQLSDLTDPGPGNANGNNNGTGADSGAGSETGGGDSSGGLPENAC